MVPRGVICAAFRSAMRCNTSAPGLGQVWQDAVIKYTIFIGSQTASRQRCDCSYRRFSVYSVRGGDTKQQVPMDVSNTTRRRQAPALWNVAPADSRVLRGIFGLWVLAFALKHADASWDVK
jgi:hypothetical protein